MRNYDEINSLDVSNPAPRCPVVLLLDVSGSMYGTPIDELNEGLKQFLRETAADEAASRSVVLEVITFSSTADIAMPFTGIGDVDQNPAPLTASGSTAMGAGMRLALQDLKARRKMYRDSGISSYRPWVILMTDGAPNDNDWEQAAEEMRILGERGKIQYIGIEIGGGGDHDIMCQILPAKPGPVRLKGLRFKQFFRWLTDSMKSVSASAVSDQNNIRYRGIDDWGEL
ncbi:MAG: VWA domain-containing protein [Victivallales bacterium]|nr:VWA domain-containing protein [Victivallales bacterium]